jgi:P4 family phage/plasmid primase-like protien
MKDTAATDAPQEASQQIDSDRSAGDQLLELFGGELSFRDSCEVWTPPEPHKLVVFELTNNSPEWTAHHDNIDQLTRSIVATSRWWRSDDTAGVVVMKRCGGGATAVVYAPNLPADCVGTFRGKWNDNGMDFRLHLNAAQLAEPITLGEIVLMPTDIRERMDTGLTLAAALLPRADFAANQPRPFLADLKLRSEFGGLLARAVMLGYQNTGTNPDTGQPYAAAYPVQQTVRAMHLAGATDRNNFRLIVPRASRDDAEQCWDAEKKWVNKCRLPFCTVNHEWQAFDIVGPLAQLVHWADPDEYNNIIEQITVAAHEANQRRRDNAAAVVEHPGPVVARKPDQVETKQPAAIVAADAVRSELTFCHECAEAFRPGFRFVQDSGKGGSWAYFRSASDAVQVAGHPPVGVWRIGPEADNALQHAIDHRILESCSPFRQTTTLTGKIEKHLRGMLAARHGEFDCNPDQIGIGTPDNPLVHDLPTGTARGMTAADFMTKLTGIQPAATVEPVWLEFVSAILSGGKSSEFDTAQLETLRQWFGAAIYGTPGTIIPILHGRGRNGKSLLLRVVAKCLGDYAAPMNGDTLLDSKAHPAGMHALRGRRLIVCDEVRAGVQWDLTNLKQLTGGGETVSRGMGQDWSNPYRPTASVVINTNHTPDIRYPTEAERRRMVRFMFPNQYAHNPNHEAQMHSVQESALRWLLDAAALHAQRARVVTVPHTLQHIATDWLGSGSDILNAVKAATEAGDLKHDFIPTGDLAKVVRVMLQVENGGLDPDRVGVNFNNIRKAVDALYDEGKQFEICRRQVDGVQGRGYAGIRFKVGYSPSELNSIGYRNDGGGIPY